ncbi:MAG: shikimate dehydrogenase [SAR324 cluster bacterium]|nr:shikimate dehydrogenase [SAR324 cluster bacterium]
MRALKLGLIGVGIEKSRAPELHRLAGKLSGIEVSYDLLSLNSAEPEIFRNALSECAAEGYSGVNITYPFKEQAAKIISIPSGQVQKLAAINTVRFNENNDAEGFNTDFSGFKRAYRSRFPKQSPGKVAIIGTGGVGRAIAFGLIDLGAEELRLFDQERRRSEELAIRLRNHTDSEIQLCTKVEDALTGVGGLVNATPIGMHHHPGTAIPKKLIGQQHWAFDAVYTPLETRFLLDAKELGLEILSGYELFFFQGIDAFEIFSGIHVDEAPLRKSLAEQA